MFKAVPGVEDTSQVTEYPLTAPTRAIVTLIWVSPSSRDTTWIAQEFDRRAATYDHSEMHRWQADQAVHPPQPALPTRIDVLAACYGLPPQCRGVAICKPTPPSCPSDRLRLMLCSASPRFPTCLILQRQLAEWRRVAQPGADLVFTTPAPDGIATLRLIRQAAADRGLALPDHASLGTTDQIADTLDNLGLLLRQVEERTFLDPLDADPRTAYNAWLESGFVDQLRNAPSATADAVYDSYQPAYRELQNRRHQPTRNHVHALHFLVLTADGHSLASIWRSNTPATSATKQAKSCHGQFGLATKWLTKTSSAGPHRRRS